MFNFIKECAKPYKMLPSISKSNVSQFGSGKCNHALLFAGPRDGFVIANEEETGSRLIVVGILEPSSIRISMEVQVHWNFGSNKPEFHVFIGLYVLEYLLCYLPISKFRFSTKATKCSNHICDIWMCSQYKIHQESNDGKVEDLMSLNNHLWNTIMIRIL